MSSDKYVHLDIENKIYSYWEKNELFKPRKNYTRDNCISTPNKV